MSETYENFARDTYSTLNNEIVEAVEQADGMPVIIFSATEHSDSDIEKFLNILTPASQEEPAMASAYTHIAAIESAVRAVGAENVVVSFEFNDRLLNDRQSYIQPAVERDDLSPSRQMEHRGLEENPVYVALYHAMDSGLETVASDPLRDAHNIVDPRRFEAEIESLESLALRTEDKPKIVVHIGGSAHIVTWQGYTMDEDRPAYINETIPQKDPQPFEGIYGSTVYFNSFQEPLIELVTPTAVEYARDPAYANQIDPPGYMDENDKDFETVISRIQATAIEQHGEAASPETAPDVTSDTVTTPRTP